MNNFSKPTSLALTAWQTEQVALLHHFASFDYLKGLQQGVRALMVEVDPTLARLQGRDTIATDKRWRSWNQSQFLSGNSWPFLAQFELSIAADLAKRAFGVYVPVDDPHGTLQFCWTGKPAARLLACQTFNALGLQSLAEVGRAGIWIDKARMHAFVQAHAHHPGLVQAPCYADSVDNPDLAASLVARNAFTSRACNWVRVEPMPGVANNFTSDAASRRPG